MKEVHVDMRGFAYAPHRLVASTLLVKRKLRLHVLLAGKRPRRGRVPRAKPPSAAALAYLAQVRELLLIAKRMVRLHVVEKLGSLVGAVEFEHFHGPLNHFVADAGGDSIRAAVARAKADYAASVSHARVASVARTAGARVDKHQQEQLDAQVRAALGVPLAEGLRGAPARLDNFVAENVSLITSVSDRYFDEVEKLVLRGANSGERAEALQERLEERFDVSESRAALIARDQTAKLMGALNEARQTDLGVKSFTWRTMDDERVRPEHAEKEGNVYDWDDPPSDTGAPGEDYQCRCWAEPVLEELKQAVDED